MYRYAITAPSTKSITINSQSFGIAGGRWGGPQLGIFSDASFSKQVDTWASDDNWTVHSESLDDMTTLKGSLIIPSGQTRYLQLTVNIGTPADAASVSVKQSFLQVVTLNVMYPQ